MVFASSSLMVVGMVVLMAAAESSPIAVVAAVAIMMEGTLGVVSIVASVAMVVVTLPLVGQVWRPAVTSFFDEH